MMAGFMSYFGGRRDPKQSSRDAIVTLRQQLQMIEKKEDYLQKKIDEEMKKAKQNAVSNKPGEFPPQPCLVRGGVGLLCLHTSRGVCLWTVISAPTLDVVRRESLYGV